MEIAVLSRGRDQGHDYAWRSPRGEIQPPRAFGTLRVARFLSLDIDPFVLLGRQGLDVALCVSGVSTVDKRRDFVNTRIRDTVLMCGRADQVLAVTAGLLTEFDRGRDKMHRAVSFHRGTGFECGRLSDWAGRMTRLAPVADRSAVPVPAAAMAYGDLELKAIARDLMAGPPPGDGVLVAAMAAAPPADWPSRRVWRLATTAENTDQPSGQPARIVQWIHRNLPGWRAS
ncbi:hypothetical protein ACWEQL_00270 [Kitasatospora sp. NPDC004240]